MNRIGVLQNKEIMYGFNSIIVQLDKINIHEAYSRLLKCLSVYVRNNFRIFGSNLKKKMSEKELKGPPISPPKSANRKTVKEEKSPRPTWETSLKIEERPLKPEGIIRPKQPLNKTPTQKVVEKPEKKKVIKKDPSAPVIKTQPKQEVPSKMKIKPEAPVKLEVIEDDDKFEVQVEDIDIEINDISYYLPRLSYGGPNHKYTLVMDLDETLVHYIEVIIGFFC